MPASHDPQAIGLVPFFEHTPPRDGVEVCLILASHFQAPPYSLYACSFSAVLPALRVRSARAEDFDDLMPIFNQQSDMLIARCVRCAPLTIRHGQFFLAELIEAQSATNLALVAEVRRRRPRRVLTRRLRGGPLGFWRPPPAWMLRRCSAALPWARWTTCSPCTGEVRAPPCG